jgi:hypothetical protein
MAYRSAHGLRSCMSACFCVAMLASRSGVWIEYRESSHKARSDSTLDFQTSTYDLVERFKKGDTGAFSLVFQKYQRRLAVLVNYKMGAELRGTMEVEDILQKCSWRQPGA